MLAKLVLHEFTEGLCFKLEIHDATLEALEEGEYVRGKGGRGYVYEL